MPRDSALYKSVIHIDIVIVHVRCVIILSRSNLIFGQKLAVGVNTYVASQRLRPVIVSTHLAPLHASFHGLKLVWATGRLMSLDCSSGLNYQLLCGQPIQETLKRFCLTRTRQRRL